MRVFGQIDKGKLGMGGACQRLECLDRSAKPRDSGIAGKDEVIAIVYLHAERGIVIRPASSACVGGRVAQRRVDPVLDRGNCRGEAGKARPGNDHASVAQGSRLSRTTDQSSARLETRTRWRGGAQPCSVIFRNSRE